MEIRLLDTADVPAIFSLLRPLYEDPKFPLGGAWTERLLETELDRGRGWGLFRNDELEAFVLFRLQAGIWDVIILGTRQSVHRQGLMTDLLTQVLSSKPEQIEVWLEVHEGNVGAQNLYKKLGFRQVGRRAQYYRDGKDAVLFSFR